MRTRPASPRRRGWFCPIAVTCRARSDSASLPLRMRRPKSPGKTIPQNYPIPLSRVSSSAGRRERRPSSGVFLQRLAHLNLRLPRVYRPDSHARSSMPLNDGDTAPLPYTRQPNLPGDRRHSRQPGPAPPMITRKMRPQPPNHTRVVRQDATIQSDPFRSFPRCSNLAGTRPALALRRHRVQAPRPPLHISIRPHRPSPPAEHKPSPTKDTPSQPQAS